MDPITQGLFGALAAQTVANKPQLAKASLIGAVGGMAPDLDVLIRSDIDPLLFLEYHRHFTHSLFFIPIGGVICGLLLFLLTGRRWRLSLGACLLWSTVGFATHGLLDACTSYGTQLLWPFSNTRVAWDIVSVIDPLFSGILLLLITVVAVGRNKNMALVAVAWVGIYFSLATYQHQRAIQWGEQWAGNNGHQVLRIGAKPSFGNILLWKVIYEAEGEYHVAAVKLGVGETYSWNGDSATKLNVGRDFPWLDPDSQQSRDLQRFAHFSDDYLAVDSNNASRIGDLRYSLLPQQIEPLWGIELSNGADKNAHVKYYTDRSDSRSAFSELLRMLTK